MRSALLALALAAAGSLAGCADCKTDGDCPAGNACVASACAPAPRACEPGATLACSCPDGSPGARTCAADGSGYGACPCGASACTTATCATVPDLAGLDLEAAGAALAAAGLSLPDALDPTGWILERRVNDPPVQVLAQEPAAGALLPRGRAPVLRVTLPPDQESLGLPHGNFLVGKLTPDDEGTAFAYYEAVDPGPYSTRLTLADWKAQNGFGGPVDDEAHAIYANKGDLGFGRHMHMVRKGTRVAMYVDNFPTLEDAIAGTRFIAAVAMEFSPPPGGAADQRHYTKFFVFDKRGQRTGQVVLDDFGFKSAPSVCIVCHGGDNADLTYPKAGDVSARFIPFDLDTLGFSDRPGYTRADQEAQFKKLNAAVAATFPPGDPIVNPNDDPSPTVELVQGWYGGPGLPRQTLDSSFTIGGWAGRGAGAEALYHEVFAKTCRLCHYQRDTARNFSTYEKFWSKMTVIRQRVFEDGAMPLSQKGHQNFWLSSPHQPTLLARWMGLSKTPSPGRPIARPVLLTPGLLRPGQVVQLDGSDSPYSRSWTWSLVAGSPGTLTPAGPRASVVAAGAGTVRVQLVTALGDLTSEPTVVDLPIVDVPDAPTGVTAAPAVDGALVRWTAPASSGNSPIDHSTITVSPGGAATTVPGAATQFTVPGLTRGATYTFTVAATNAAKLSGVSSAPSAPYRVPTPPDAPTAVSAVRANASAQVSWSAPPSDGGLPVTGYTVTASPGGASATTAGATSVLVSGLTNGTATTFTVVAHNDSGDSPPSAPSAPVTPATKPGAPSGVSAVAGNAQASVSWSVPASDGGAPINRYTVTASPGGQSAVVTCTPPTPCAAGATVAGLANGTPTTFTVVAANAVGDGPASAPSSPVTPATLPGAPTGVAAVRGNGAATVSWTAPAPNGAPITAYLVTASPGGQSALVSCAPPAACATAAVVSGLANGAACTFTVTATNSVGTGPASAPSNAVIPATVPGAPSAVAATGAQDGQAAVSWSAPASDGGSPVTSYLVTSSPGGKTASVACAPPAACATNAVVTGLANGTATTFTVVAGNDVGAGAASAPSAAVVPSRAPGAPTAVTASAGVGSANVAWTAPASNGGAAITLYTVTSSPGSLTATTGGSTSTTVNGLTNGVQYTFTVTATNVSGTGPASAASNATVPSTNPNLPSAPRNVVATGATEQATVTWTAPLATGTAGPITGYLVTAVPGGQTATAGAAGTSATVVGLTGSRTANNYSFLVVAQNVGGNGEAASSNATSVVGRPQSPTGVAATRGDQSVSVAWSAPADDGGSDLTGFTVTLFDASTNAAVSSTAAAASPKVLGGLANGTAVYARVTATNALGTSAPSAASGAVTPAGVPFAPAAPTATRGAGQASVAWTAPAANGSAITGYTVTASPGGATASVTCSPSCTTAATVAGLTNGTSYTFTVKAANAVGSSAASPASNAVVPATLPGAPTSVSATRGDTQASVSWIAAVPNDVQVTGYGVLSSPGGKTATVSCTPPTPCATNATVAGLTNGTSYTFTVTATNSVGTGSASAASNAVVPAGVPSAPTGVAGVRGNAKVTVSWTASASSNGDALTSYVVTGSPAGSATVNCSPPGTCATSVDVTGLTNGTSYTFTVKAANTVGSSAASAASAAVVPATVPGAPTIGTATAGVAAATVSWSPPASNGGDAITLYEIEVSSSGLTTTTATAGAAATSKAVAGLVTCAYGAATANCARFYSFRVRALNGVGAGAYSGSVSVNPLVSYASDNVDAIWSATLPSALTCMGCHDSAFAHSFCSGAAGTCTGLTFALDAASATNRRLSASAWAVAHPSANTLEGAPSSAVYNMCGAQVCITTLSNEYKTLAAWVADGRQP